jgi:hypothetical protein
VQLSRDGRFIYYTSWSGKYLCLYDRQQQRVRKTEHLAFYPDNLSVREDGSLLVAGNSSIEDWRFCFKAKAPFCSESSVIATLDRESVKTASLLSVPPDVISGVSVGLQIGGQMYVGSPVGDRIVAIAMTQSKK